MPISYLCRPGVSRSLVTLKRDLGADDLDICDRLLGLAPARHGKRYRHTVACPVNGDGYYYTRQWMLDADGVVVGSIRVDGPCGEI